MRRKLIIAALAAFLPLTVHAACSDDVDSLASKYGITAALPHTGADSSNASSEALAKSGGVISPPATGDMAGASPPVPDPEPMATAPSIAPQTADGSKTTKGGAKQEASAATQSQAASLLQAARAASMKGDESACTQRLTDAKALLEKAPTQSQ